MLGSTEPLDQVSGGQEGNRTNNLKRTEIITALKQYSSSQGISLVGKTVEIAFTAGRKETGTSAEITIEDTAGLPPVAAVAVIAPTLVGATDQLARDPVVATVVAQAETAAGAEAGAPFDMDEKPAEPAKATTSLFN